MSITRRKHSSAFKLKVALAAIKGDKTISELCQQYEVHASMVNKWKLQLQRDGSKVFDSGESSPSSSSRDQEIEKLHAKIGRLTMEKDFLKKALDL
jgi:transposase-like protein